MNIFKHVQVFLILAVVALSPVLWAGQTAEKADTKAIF